MEKSEIQVDSSEIHGVNAPTDEHAVNIPVASTWPTQPKPLVLSKRERYLWAAYDLILIALPIGLIIKTALVIFAKFDDAPNTGAYFDQASSLSIYLARFNNQLVTLFTIGFVTIMSTFVKRYALWKAQEGAYLSDLEQLQGSVSLPSTLKLIWSLGSYSTLSATLIFVWIFYYLGSQAAKDEYIASNSEPFRYHDAVFQRPDTPTPFSPGFMDILGPAKGETQEKVHSSIREINYRFANALLQARLVEGWTDLSNLGTNQGPLMPDLHAVYSTYDQLKVVDGYVDVSRQAKNAHIYVNAEGVFPYIVDYWDCGSSKPCSGITMTPMLGTYSIPTRYISVACGRPQLLPIEEFPKNANYNSSFSLNITSYRSDAPLDAAGHPLREFEYWYRASLPISVSTTSSLPDPVINWSSDALKYQTVKAMCNVTTKEVDLEVSCVTTGCYSRRMRWRDNANETAATSYSTPFDSEEFSNTFLSNLSVSTGSMNKWDSAKDDQPLVGYFLYPAEGEESLYYPQLYSLIAPSQSMTLLFNTYVMISQKLTPIGFDLDTILQQGFDIAEQKITVYGADFDRAYRISWVWIPIDFIASFILLAAAIASWRLRLKTLAPDIFGYVSSLTRENEHVSLPTQGSMLSGMDRARMLKRVKVKIGEVSTRGSDEQEGNSVIGLAPIHTGVSGLQRERLYY